MHEREATPEDRVGSERPVAVVPLGLWDAMAYRYFGGTDIPRISTPGENVIVPEGIFIRLCEAYYGKGDTLPGRRERERQEAEATAQEAATKAKTRQYGIVDLRTQAGGGKVTAGGIAKVKEMRARAKARAAAGVTDDHAGNDRSSEGQEGAGTDS